MRRKLHHLIGKRGLNADPEGVVHHIVGVGKVAADTLVCSDHVGLARKVSGKQQAGANLVLVQIGEQIEPRYGAVFF